MPRIPPRVPSPPPPSVIEAAYKRFGRIRRRLNCSKLQPLEGFRSERYEGSPAERVAHWELATSYSWLVLCDDFQDAWEMEGRNNRKKRNKDTDSEDEGSETQGLKAKVSALSEEYARPKRVRGAIGVPGVPPMFTNPKCPFTLGNIVPKNRVVDHNPPDMKSFQPLFQALLYTKPDFNMNRVHFVADVDFLSDLWSIVSRTLAQRTEWRYDFRQQERTVIFSRVRQDLMDQRYSTIDQLLTTCTKYDDDFASSLSHYRVVNWEFAGIHCLIRFKSDCYLPTKLAFPLPEDQMTQWHRKTYPFPDWYQNMRFEGFENLEWPLPGENPPSAAFIPCQVGQDLGKILAKHLPRLYFTRQKYMLVAMVDGDSTKAHKKNVSELRLIDCGTIWEAWEKENEDVLQRLGALIRYTLTGIGYNTRSMGSMVLRDGVLSILEPVGDRFDRSGLHGGEFPEMPHPGRKPIIHLWRTLGKDSLPEKWRASGEYSKDF